MDRVKRKFVTGREKIKWIFPAKKRLFENSEQIKTFHNKTVT